MKRKTKKKLTSAGSFMRKVQRAPAVRTVRNKIRRKKEELKKLSTAYKRAVKLSAKRLAKRKR